MRKHLYPVRPSVRNTFGLKFCSNPPTPDTLLRIHGMLQFGGQHGGRHGGEQGGRHGGRQIYLIQ